LRYKSGVSDAAGSSAPPRRRAYQTGALLVAAAAIAAVLIAVLGGSSTSDLKPGKPVPGARAVLALLAGIPQQGEALGDPRAPVTLVEFGDLQCPTCSEFAIGALPAIVSRYVRSRQVRLVFRPVSFIGPDSRRAAGVALAVARQRRMWQFLELMYRNQGLENGGYVTDTYLRALLGAIPGADAPRALADRGSAAVQAQLGKAAASARAAHVSSTPSFLLARSGETSRRFTPAGLGFGSFRAAFERLLAPAKPRAGA
jgi:protein-disulfide isomerase